MLQFALSSKRIPCFSLLQTDEEILVDLRKKNQKLSEKLSKMPKKVIDDKESHQVRAHGTKMVLEQYVKWLDVDNEKSPDVSSI